jgi:hypothetical protein
MSWTGRTKPTTTYTKRNSPGKWKRGYYLLNEDGSYILNEDGSKIVLEEAPYIWDDRSDKTTVWGKRVEPSNNWSNRSKPTTNWTS